MINLFREKIVAIKKRMSDLSTDFQTNMSEDKTFLEFTREELAGVPEDLLNTFEKVRFRIQLRAFKLT